MLLEREIEATGIEDWVATSARAESASRPVAVVATTISQPEAGTRYGEGKRFSPAAITATMLLHVALAAGLLALSAQRVSEQRERLTVVDLSLDSPPPPPAPPAQPVDTALDTQVPTPLTPVPVVQPPVLPLVPEAVALPQAAAPQSAAQPAPPAPPAPAAPAAPPSMVSASDLDSRMIAGGPPGYPVESRRKREQGIVELLVIVGLDGRVEAISVSRSSGFERLDKAALGAVRKWRWSPTVRDGAATKVRGTVEIPFVLQGTN